MSLLDFDTCEVEDCPSSKDLQTWFCVSCCTVFCDTCWAKERCHKPGKVGQDGLPHEKTSKEVHTRLRDVFTQTEKQSELLQLHIDDEETLWFAIEKAENEQCRFTDQGRFTQIMMMTKQPTPGPRCPLLVSFVGQTGAGKSTLIKMLVSLKDANLSVPRDEFFKSPVSGSRKDDRSPTSGDVHLYVDPQSAFSEFPMLYADCEGLEGGETPPQAQSIKKKITKKVTKNSSKVREMKIPTDKGKLGTREWAVRNVYPRLLYTFSDVVCFVLKNTRTFESVALQLLLEWAATSLESSVNQAALPQAVIVLNSSEPTMANDEWEVTTATSKLMEQVKYAIHTNEQLRKYCDFWLQRGKIIHTTEELLRCYYKSVHVVRVPVKGRDMQMKLQVDKLHATLMEACNHSISAKLAARRFCTTEELDRYLQAAFDHFADTPEQPFNFIDVALKAYPIPQSFADHIITLAMGSSKLADFASRGEALEAFTRLSPIIASYIALDCVRYSRPGRPADLFDQHYAGSCSSALDKFYDLFLPCDFTNRKGIPCCNRMNSHDKGHQDENGKVIGIGGFQSPLDIEADRKNWLSVIHKSLVILDSEIDDAHAKPGFTAKDRRKTTHEIHRMRLVTAFARKPGGLSGNYTCYACLMEIAQHPLPCGHMVCTECVKMLGWQTDKNTFTIEACPFDNKSSPCSIRFKPSFAGVRVLSLDGGGIRGIVELESLRAIQRVLGPDLPIQDFFDLIVGTSTGGIIALGLGVKQWSVEQCADRFVRLCAQAFVPKSYNKFIPQKLAQSPLLMMKYNRYKTRPLYRVLEQEFGHDPLYGKVPDDNVVRDTKVCVTTTPLSAEWALAVGNYARQSEEDHWYKYERGDLFRIWQAAAATSAAPGYFKVFNLMNNGRILSQPYRIQTEFVDGALYFNNPVRLASNERRFLWPDVADIPPDILLSLGTGQNTEISSVVNKESMIRTTKSRAFCLPESKYTRLVKGLHAKGNRKHGVVKHMIVALCNMMDSILDAEREYKIFKQEQSHASDSDRYIRLNPDLGEDPPRLDDQGQMLRLQALVAKQLKTPEYELTVERIAYRLVASSFYFEKSETIEHDEVEDNYVCKGRIACRFEGRANDMKNCIRNVGKFLRQQSTASFRPFLTIASNVTGEGGQQIELTQRMIDSMINDADFCIAENVSVMISDKRGPTTIALNLLPSRFRNPEPFPLSGFPRHLVTESASTASRLQKRAEILKTKIKKSELLVGESIYHMLQATEAAEAAEAHKAAVSSKATDTAIPRRAGGTSVSSVVTDDAQLDDTPSPSSSKTSLHQTISNTSKEHHTFKDKLWSKVERPRTPGSRSPDLARALPVSPSAKKDSGALSTGHREGSNSKTGSYVRIDDLDDEDEILVRALKRPVDSASTALFDALELTEETGPHVNIAYTTPSHASVGADTKLETYVTTMTDDDDSDE